MESCIQQARRTLISAIETYEELVPEYGFTIETRQELQQPRIFLWQQKACCAKVDCMTNLTDNTVVNIAYHNS